MTESSMFLFNKKDVVCFCDFIDLVDWSSYSQINLIIDDQINIIDIDFSKMRDISKKNVLRVQCVRFEYVPDYDVTFSKTIIVYVKRCHKKETLFF